MPFFSSTPWRKEKDASAAEERGLSVATTLRRSGPNSSSSSFAQGIASDKTTEKAALESQSLTYDQQPNWPRGWRPWGCLFGCFLLMFNSWGLVNSYGTFSSWYKQHLLPGRDLLFWNIVGATECFIVLALSAVVGRLLDAAYSRYLIATGAFLVTLGMFLLSVVNGDGGYDSGNYGLIWLTQGFIVGLGMACFFVSSSQIAATWFVKRKSIAVGIVASGASISGLIYPMLFKFVLPTIGFNNAVRAVAGLVGFTVILSFFLCVPNPAHPIRKPKSWASVNAWIDPHAFRNPAFNWFTAAIAFVFLGFYPVFFNLEEWAAHYGFGQKDVPPGFDEVRLSSEVKNDAIRTFWLLCILNASSTSGRLISSAVSERWGTVRIHCFSTGIGSLLLLLLWPFATTLAPALCFVIIFGAVSGAIIGLPPASMAYILDRRDTDQQAKLGQWTGMMYACAAVPSFIGPLVAGHLITEFGNNYLTVQLWAGFSLLIAAGCMFMSELYAGRIHRRNAIARGEIAEEEEEQRQDA